MPEKSSYKLLDELEALETTIYTVNRNFDELNKIDEWFKQKGIEIQKLDTMGELDGFYREYSRRLHNYIVSVYSLICHTQRINGSYCSDDFSNKDRSIEDVYTKGLERFDIKTRWKFLQQFRHHIQKNQIPSLNIKVIQNEEGFRFGILVKRDEMLQKGTFKHWGREYLKSLDAEIDIQLEVRRYHSNVNDFYSWYYEAIQEERADALNDRKELENKLENRRSELFDGLR